MRVAWFDIISGISGDMTLGACVNAGVPFDTLREELQKLPLDGYALSQRTLTRNHIAAVKIDVQTPDGMPEHHHRGYTDIARIIDTSTLKDAVKERAKAIFLTLARAEAHVHGTTVEKVHFHEVGAVDSIVDIVGAAICMDLLGIERVYTSVVRTGSGGSIETRHGIMPVPAPATMEILKGYPVELTNIPYELTTPTGAAITATLSHGLLAPSIPFTVSAVGYGAGSKEIPGTPNLLRVLIGEIPDEEDGGSAEVRAEQLVQLETNIDDMNPELFPFVMERLFEEGARDVWLAPVLMKKGRPAHVLSVLAEARDADALRARVFAETSTTGIRMTELIRHALPREQQQAETRFGPVTVKVIRRGEQITRVPEYEECRRVAREQNLPLIQAYQQIALDLASPSAKDS